MPSTAPTYIAVPCSSVNVPCGAGGGAEGSGIEDGDAEGCAVSVTGSLCHRRGRRVPWRAVRPDPARSIR
ncbi:hypothetical protein GCM10009665_63930 [Kitasatospora nipponensis]|uniref:Uncharacterized protein n=1 Tax=Kitasatospora nipponensis TaxID=258049 RepID=A0ABN1WXH9_9ACTN